MSYVLEIDQLIRFIIRAFILQGFVVQSFQIQHSLSVVLGVLYLLVFFCFGVPLKIFVVFPLDILLLYLCYGIVKSSLMAELSLNPLFASELLPLLSYVAIVNFT